MGYRIDQETTRRGYEEVKDTVSTIAADGIRHTLSRLDNLRERNLDDLPVKQRAVNTEQILKNEDDANGCV